MIYASTIIWRFLSGTGDWGSQKYSDSQAYMSIWWVQGFAIKTDKFLMNSGRLFQVAMNPVLSYKYWKPSPVREGKRYDEFSHSDYSKNRNARWIGTKIRPLSNTMFCCVQDISSLANQILLNTKRVFFPKLWLLIFVQFYCHVNHLNHWSWGLEAFDDAPEHFLILLEIWCKRLSCERI